MLMGPVARLARMTRPDGGAPGTEVGAGGHPLYLGMLVAHFLGRRRRRVMTRRMGIVLEIPDEMSRHCQLDGCSSYSDGRNSRARKPISRPSRADVGIDDVCRLLRREARK